MSLVKVEDLHGKTMTLIEMNGRRYPQFPVDTLRHATEIKARPDDILLSTYPKSGTHWISTIVRYLLSGNTVSDYDFVSSFVDLAERDVINGLPTDSPRLLYSHFHADTLSHDFIRQKCKIIHVTRDPRDVMTSYLPHRKKLTHYYDVYDGDWKGHFHLFLDGKMDYDSWFEHTKGWEKCMKEHPNNPFLVLSYEGVIQDPLGNVKKISDFIGMNHSEEFLEEVIKRTSFDSMVADVKRELDAIFFRKGQAGDWKNHFTVAQSEMFNERFEKEMAGTEAYKLYSHKIEK